MSAAGGSWRRSHCKFERFVSSLGKNCSRQGADYTKTDKSSPTCRAPLRAMGDRLHIERQVFLRDPSQSAPEDRLHTQEQTNLSLEPLLEYIRGQTIKAFPWYPRNPSTRRQTTSTQRQQPSLGIPLKKKIYQLDRLHKHIKVFPWHPVGEPLDMYRHHKQVLDTTNTCTHWGHLSTSVAGTVSFDTK